MRFTAVAAAAVALLALASLADAQEPPTLKKGDCFVNITLESGLTLGLDKSPFSTTLTYNSTKDDLTQIKTKGLSTSIKSKGDSERGAVTGTVILKFPPNSLCNFTATALDKGDPQKEALAFAFKGIQFVEEAANSTIDAGITVGDFSGSKTGGRFPYNFAVSGLELDYTSNPFTIKVGSSGGSAAFRPYYFVQDGNVTALVDYSEKVKNPTRTLTGSFGIANNTAFGEDSGIVPKAGVASTCKLSLKKKNGVPTLSLACSGWKIPFVQYTNVYDKATLIFKKGSGNFKGSVALTTQTRF